MNRSEMISKKQIWTQWNELSSIDLMQVEQAVDADPYKTFVVVPLTFPSELLDMARAKLSLIKATRHVKDKPILVIALDGGFLIGRFVVPEVNDTSIIF